MSTEPAHPEPDLPGSDVPCPPAYAWRWLQRSRPVVRTIAERLTGGPPPAGFVDELRAAFEADAFTRTIVVDVIAEVAFGGRVPRRQPAGASWDRGLRWWAATLAGVDVADFDGPATAAAQPGLFDSAGDATPLDGSAAGGEHHGVSSASALVEAARKQVPHTTPERLALARSLRELLAASGGDQVPASALRQLIEHLEGGSGPAPRSRD